MSPPVTLLRHPAERGRRPGAGDALYCGGCGCCCCCCCCLHTVGGFLGAMAAGAGRPAAGADDDVRVTGTGPPAALPQEDLEVLGAFALFRAADRCLGAHSITEKAFLSIGQAARERAQAAWERLFPGRRAEVVAWSLERLPLLVDEGLLSPATCEHLHRTLDGEGAAAGGDLAVGPMAQLWRLHTLYMEIAAAAEAGALPVETLPRIRAHVFLQVIRAAADLGAYQGSATTGQFGSEVLEEAGCLLRALEAEQSLPRAEAQALASSLTGGPPSEAAEATCPLCGDALARWTQVHCAACGAPHHELCWRYEGGCAAFACGCVEARERRPEDAREIRFDLSGGPGQDHEAAPAARATSLFWAFFACLCVGSSVFQGPFGVLLEGPLLQILACVAAMVIVAVRQAPGTGDALRQLGRIALFTILGCMLGLLAIPALFALGTTLLPLLKGTR